jgi:hypothetical protein
MTVRIRKPLMLLQLHQKIAPEWSSNLVGLFEVLSFARGLDVWVS